MKYYHDEKINLREFVTNKSDFEKWDDIRYLAEKAELGFNYIYRLNKQLNVKPKH